MFPRLIRQPENRLRRPRVKPEHNFQAALCQAQQYPLYSTPQKLVQAI
ncbi:hypothetical protein [Kingella oralis]|uniref:Uncharacterized protein n=1 Tax=Kingella oralis ATCC 51147 TaxID=629741 RepID=C4GMC5_9NEIS|nr:hypothetical protein [Kingella oralis]EEP66883.1 hypothetical protein GCWU000324_02858 [Kingella oralis ATCC 51147]QMT42735.1 hypothetical protein H3L93_12435 [Kingella oralis]